MIGETQLILHGETDENGDCFRAALATLLGLPAQEVPHFCSKAEEGQWPENVERWLERRRWRWLVLSVPPEAMEHCQRSLQGVTHLMSGPSPRFPDERHCVVASGMEMIWDPHPDRSGLGAGDLTIDLLLPIGGYRGDNKLAR